MKLAKFASSTHLQDPQYKFETAFIKKTVDRKFLKTKKTGTVTETIANNLISLMKLAKFAS